MGDELSSLSNDGRIATEKSGHIFLIVIDRPKKLNGFSVKMLSELGQAFSAMEDDSDIRCGVLCAEGRNFTAGLELNQVAKHLAEGALFPEDNVDPVNLHGRLRTKPLVSAVQGICFTLGIELMLASDIVVAASDCRFAQIEVKRGIMPSAGATIRMTERAGLGNAATKGAIDTLVKHFASLLGARGIRVNAVAPGVIETDMSAFAKTDAGREYALGMQAFKRLAQPDDIGGVVAFLASDDARWITGDTIHVDGGSKL